MKLESEFVMKTIHISHIILIIFLVFSPEITNLAGAQSTDDPTPNVNGYNTYTPSIAIVIVVLISALFLAGFFSVYLRHCSGVSTRGVGPTRPAITLRRKARGLDASVMESFPTLCDHVFHPQCIDVWLGSHVTCPVCRADLLVPNASDDPITIIDTTNNENLVVERSDSRNEEVRVEIDANGPQREEPSRPPRSWSVKKFASVGKFSFKFKSHSTGHSLVLPVENLERFTLRLPAEVRKEIMEQATLNRTRSCAATLPRERSTRRGYRGGGSREGRFYQRINQSSEGEAKSEKWNFFKRSLSLKLPNVVAETGQGSSGKGAPVKMQSFN